MPSHLPDACLRALVVLGLGLAALAQVAPPIAITNARLAAGEDASSHTLLIQDGKLLRVLPADAALPPHARVIDAKRSIAVPAFVDAYTWTGCQTSEPKADRDVPTDERADVAIDMRTANRKGIQPAFHAADVLAFEKDKLKPWRESGFGALHVAPHGQILAGTSALAVSRELPAREAILAGEVFTCAGLEASGPGFPSTIMGYVSQLRQFFWDARRHAEIVQRAAQGRSGPRPPRDLDLEAAQPILAQERRLLCRAERAHEIERWLALGDELGFGVAIVGGVEAWKLAPKLAARNVPVILTLDWGDEPEDPHAKDKEKKGETKEGEKKPDSPPPAEAPPAEAPPATQDEPKPTEAPQPAEAGEKKAEDEKKADDEKKAEEYKEPLAVREERRRLWDEKRDGAKALSEAGVHFAFGSAGGSASELLKKVRQLVERGLPEDAALRALASDAATILGGHSIGALEPGRDATFALWNAAPLGKDAQLAWLFVDGVEHEFEIKPPAKSGEKPAEGVSAAGTWDFELQVEFELEGSITLTQTPEGEVSGTLVSVGPAGELSMPVKGNLAGKKLTLSGSADLAGAPIEVRVEVELDGDSFSGTNVSKGAFGEMSANMTGKRRPNHSEVR